MHLALPAFCSLVKPLRKTNAEKAMAILWYHDYKEPGIRFTSGELARMMGDYHVGTPNSTQLARDIRSTKLANENGGRFALRPGSRDLIRSWLSHGLDGVQPSINHAEGYLPEDVWGNTRRYVESVARQLNGCIHGAYYDAALVMLRRLIETLIIESYEHLGRKAEIQTADGNYHMLASLVDRATSSSGLAIGRGTKNALNDVKALGDRAAHDRRFQANAADLTKIQIGARSAVQDLIQIAALQVPRVTAA